MLSISQFYLKDQGPVETSFSIKVLYTNFSNDNPNTLFTVPAIKEGTVFSAC